MRAKCAIIRRSLDCYVVTYSVHSTIIHLIRELFCLPTQYTVYSATHVPSKMTGLSSFIVALRVASRCVGDVSASIGFIDWFSGQMETKWMRSVCRRALFGQIGHIEQHKFAGKTKWQSFDATVVIIPIRSSHSHGSRRLTNIWTIKRNVDVVFLANRQREKMVYLNENQPWSTIHWKLKWK